jgi:hypothetical protein
MKQHQGREEKTRLCFSPVGFIFDMRVFGQNQNQVRQIVMVIITK